MLEVFREGKVGQFAEVVL